MALVDWKAAVVLIRNAGISFPEIERRTGLNSDTLANIATGRQRTVEWEFGTVLLDVAADVLPSDQLQRIRGKGAKYRDWN